MSHKLIGCALLALCAGSAASAQDEAARPDEILVTAQKRVQRIQDTPLPITAFGADALEAARVTTLADLTMLAPGFNGVATSPTQPLLNIRGVGSNDFSVGNDPALGVFIDEVYAGRNGGALSELFDIERVEVVRGPQGTLFGRNTTAGAIAIFRQRPTATPTGSVEASIASFNEVRARAILSGPLTDGIMARAGVSYSRDDGYRTRTIDGSRIGGSEGVAARLAFRAEPTDTLTFDLDFDYESRDAAPAITQSRSFNGSAPPRSFFDTSQNLTEDQAIANREIFVSSLKSALTLSDAWSLTSVTAFRTYDLSYLEDTDGGPTTLLHIGVEEKQDSYSQELRLNYDGERLTFFVGGSWYREDVAQTTTANYSEEAVCGALARRAVVLTLPCGPLLNALSGGRVPASFTGLASVTEANNATGRYTSIGLYSDLTWKLTDKLRLIVGGRFSRDVKEVEIDNPVPVTTVAPIAVRRPTIILEPTAGVVRQRAAWSDFSPRFVVQFDAMDDLMLYASASRGFKSGGFNLLTPSSGAFEPETVWSYDAGVKGALGDGLLSYDLNGFYYRYTDLQVQITNAFPVTQNAGRARGYGVEGQFQLRPGGGFRLSGNFAFLNARYSEYSPSPGVDFSGSPLIRAPDFSGSLQADYETSLGTLGDLMFMANVTHRSGVFDAPGSNEARRVDGFTLVNSRITWSTPANIELTLFADNLFDRHYVAWTQQVEALGIRGFMAGRPRVVGVRAGWQF